MDWLINQISKRNGVSTQPLYSLLEFSSFFENSFSKIEIQNFNNNELDVQNLDVAKSWLLLPKKKLQIIQYQHIFLVVMLSKYILLQNIFLI